MASLVPELAPVRPRVRGTGLDSSRLLEEVVEEYAEDFSGGLLWLVGQQGAGKSTALAHLSAVFQGDDRYAFVDDADSLADEKACESVYALCEDAIVIAARRKPFSTGHRILQLESWSADEFVEYLLAEHRVLCSSVMQRLGDEARQSWTPEIARVVLDQFVNDDSLSDPQSALLAYLHRELPNAEQFATARRFCLAFLKNDSKLLQSTVPAWELLPPHVKKSTKQRVVQIPLAAEQVKMALSSWRSPRVLEGQLPLQLVEEVSQHCQADEGILQRLEEILQSRWNSKSHAMAASILYAADSKWCPATEAVARDFSGAYFSRVNWPEISLAGARLELAEFFEANLARACFDEAILVETDFVQANLHSASLKESLAVGADFSYANLQGANLCRAKLESASLVAANLRQAELWKANLCQTDLTGACFFSADLTEAMLVSATLNNVDFTKCNLTRVDARHVDLRTAKLDGAVLEEAWLNNANLENIFLKHACFYKAGMRSAHLTGSRLPSANLRGADLSEAGLGEIDWENADLREANLSGATFHMGSSRSGLIDSPIACEGSRTGFYTDELEELYFKSPEQVRKANLRGADLRGANLKNVDFYLVDLRDAKLDPRQRQQARRTGAILSGND